MLLFAVFIVRNPCRMVLFAADPPQLGALIRVKGYAVTETKTEHSGTGPAPEPLQFLGSLVSFGWRGFDFK